MLKKVARLWNWPTHPISPYFAYFFCQMRNTHPYMTIQYIFFHPFWSHPPLLPYSLLRISTTVCVCVCQWWPGQVGPGGTCPTGRRGQGGAKMLGGAKIFVKLFFSVWNFWIFLNWNCWPFIAPAKTRQDSYIHRWCEKFNIFSDHGGQFE